MKLMLTVNVTAENVDTFCDICEKWIESNFCEEYQVYQDNEMRPDIIKRDE